MSLYEHLPHLHVVKNVNVIYNQNKKDNLNEKIGTFVTKMVSTMWAAYAFAILSCIGLLGLLGVLTPFAFLLTTWISQQFLQLVFLPILAVGQDVLSRHQQLQADETYQTTMKIFHESEQMKLHMEAQDAEILALKNLLLVVVKKVA